MQSNLERCAKAAEAEKKCAKLQGKKVEKRKREFAKREHVQASKKVALNSESKVADIFNVKLYILTEKPINLQLKMLYFSLLTIFTLRWS